jgi:hypothetical protein
MLDQPAHIQQRILTLPTKRQPRRHLLNEAAQPRTNRGRRQLDYDRRLHPLLLDTMTADADTVRGQTAGPFSELTKSY